MVIRPKIAYGSVAWWKKGQQQLAQVKLSSLQRQACLLITGAFRTTPTAAMETVLGLTPCIFTCTGNNNTAIRRLQICHMEDTVLLRDIMSRDLLCMPSNVMPQTICYSQTYNTVFPTGGRKCAYIPTDPKLWTGSEPKVTASARELELKSAWARLRQYFRQKSMQLSFLQQC